MTPTTWMQDWQPMRDAIGTDFGRDYVQTGADRVEAGAIRRFLEPLEFDCRLHDDPQTALAHGYRDLIAPCSSLLMWVIPPLWEPGTQVWNRAGRDAQPDLGMRMPWSGDHIPQPRTAKAFATNLEVEYIEPITVGDRLSLCGARLLECQPKETAVGRGAFLTWQTEVKNQDQTLIARICYQRYCYNPRDDGAHAAQDAPPAGASNGTH